MMKFLRCSSSLARSFPRLALALGFFALAAGPTALLAQTNIVTTLAGTAGGQGSIDGTGRAARFYEPTGVAVDGLGNVYIADRSNHTIRKITGGGIVTTLAGFPGLAGTANGTGSLARFNQPTGVAVDSVGNVYVADGGNHTIRKITGGGIVTTLAGTAGATGGNDATGAAAQFNEPRGVTVDSAGNVYVADYRNHTIRKITAGGVVTTPAGFLGVGGSTDGSGFAARFNLPSGVAVDSAGNVYVADSGNHTIRKVTSGGVVTTLAGTASLTGGSVNGTGAAAQFNLPTGVAVDGGGTVYVADLGNHTIRRITSVGVVTTPVGTAGIAGVTDGAGPAGLLVHPWSVALGGANLYVTDPRNHTIRLVTDTPPAFKSASTASGMVAESFEHTIIVHGALTLSASALPAGLSLDASSKVISGTATAAGTFPITLTATNNNGSSTSTLTVTIAGIVAAERYTFTTLAGKAGSFGNVEGTGGDARFGILQRMAVDSAGNVYVAVGGDGSGDSIQKISRAGVVSTLAGGPGGAGSTDGVGSAARFKRPEGVAVDSAGNVYVADTENHTIRKITPAGLVTTLAGTAETEGSADGIGSAARFKYPTGVAVDSAGNIYVADKDNYTIRKITSGGLVTTFAGSAGKSGSTNGSGAAASFSGPVDVTVDSAGNVYVVDNSYSVENYNTALIRKITSSGNVTTLAGSPGLAGSNYGTGAAARFSSPKSVAVDSVGNVFVADSGNHTIRKIAINGLVTTVAGVAGSSGAVNGTGSVARFNFPFGIAVDSAGSVYVAEELNFTIRRGAAGAPVLRSASTASGQVGEPFAYAAILPGAMAISATDVPTGLTFDVNSAAISGTPGAAGTYPITFDASNSVGSLRVTVTLTVAARSPGTPSYTFSTLAGLAGIKNSTDGTGSATRFDTPTAAAADSAGNLYIADQGSHTIRKVTSAGVVSTLAGSAGQAGSTNGTGAAARFNYPAGLMVDTAGNVYVADTENHTIRKITSGGVVSTLAGTAGASGSTNSTGAAARFNSPTGLAMDAVGNIYVADSANNSIRVITPAGVVTTLAGETGPPGSADGTGGAARFNGPFGVAVDPVSKDVFVSDTGNHTIRKITLGGVVTTLAGTAGSAGAAAGTGSAARFNSPYGIAVDRSGSILVADSGNHTIRMITGGAVTTLGGAAGSPGAADAIGSAARFNLPRGVVMDSAGNLYVADFGNATIRKGTPSAAMPTFISQPSAQTATTGANVTFSVAVSGNPAPTYQWRRDGTAIAGATGSSLTLNAVVAGQAGSYTVVATNSAGFATSAAALLTVSGTATEAPAYSFTTLAGLAGSRGTLDGTGSAARFDTPAAVAIDRAGNLYVADQGSHTIRKITSDGVVSTLAGTPGTAGSTDGVGTDARFNSPAGVAVDSAGDVFVADSSNHTIRKITSGGIVSTLAGTAGVAGSVNATGAAARFNSPVGIAVAGSIVYVADAGNHTIRTVSKREGFVGTLAGVAGSAGSADGTISAARFNRPTGVAYDEVSHTAFVADTGNHTIRQIAPNFGGTVTTLAGTAGSPGSTDGTGSAARFNSPNGIAMFSSFVADSDNHTIRMLGGAAVTTLGGTAGVPGAVDAAGSAARFNLPRGVVRDNAGNLYVVDSGNATIRKGTPPVVGPTVTSQPVARTTTAGGTATLSVNATGNPAPTYQWRKDGTAIAGATDRILNLSAVSAGSAGSYTVVVTNSAGSVTSAPAVLSVTAAAGPSSALSNLSVRTTMATGQVLIVGAVVSGGAKTILVRGAGPALNAFGLTGMVDPRLELFATGAAPTAVNDDWPAALSPTFASVGAFPFATASRDAALSQSINGAFTVQARGTGPGALLVEAYDVAGGMALRMINLSARNQVGTGDDILIAGFNLTGTGTKQVLIRAVGPGLAAFGVQGVLEDPRLQVVSASGAVVAVNDNWAAALAATFAQVGAFGLTANSRDAALLITLNAGTSYTVQVSGVDGGTGEALIEVYEIL